MKAFKLVLKLVRDQLPSIMIYLFIFSLIFGLNTRSFIGQQHEKIELEKACIVIEDQDNSELSQHFRTYMEKNSLEPPTDLGSDPETLKEAIYSAQIDYAVIIPKGFTAYLLADKKADKIPLQTYRNSLANAAIPIDLKIENYVNSWQSAKTIFAKDISKGNLTNAIAHLDKILNVETSIYSFGNKETDYEKALGFSLAFANYVIIAVSFLVIGKSILTMEDAEMKRRDVASGYPESKRAGGIFAAGYVIMTVIWLLLVIICLSLVGWDQINSPGTFYKLGSSFLHMLAVVSFSILICHLFPQQNAINFMSTFFSLLVAFSSGMFVPAEFLWEPFHKASSIFPSYWDVKVQHGIDALLRKGDSLAAYYKNISIIAGFAVLFFLLTLLYRHFSAGKLKEA